MSRCFPFPPPGYEKKTRADDINLLKKEKHREKKHKKEKRDKDKKDSKEKREEDRSDEKQREKKEKKEKHRDKKKDKEKNQDKDKNNHVMSDEKKLLRYAEADKGEKIYEKSKKREKEKGIVLGENVVGNSKGYSEVVLVKNSRLVTENKDFKRLHELGNNIATEEGKRNNLSSDKHPSTAIKKDVGMPRMGVTTPVTPMATSERSKDRKANDGRMDRHGPGAGGRPIQNALVQKIAGVPQNRVEAVARQVEKNADRRMEVKKKIRGMEGNGQIGEKRKGEDIEKSIEKCKENDKKIKVERPKDMGGEMLVEQSRFIDSNKVHADLLRPKDGNKNDFLVARTARHAKLVKEDNKAFSATTPEILRKRKEFGFNGVLHEGDVGPNKMPRITSSSLPMIENGRRPSQNSTSVFGPVKQQALSNANKQDEGDVGPNKMARNMSSSLPMTENGRSLQPFQDSTFSTPFQDSTFSTPVKQQALSKIKQDSKDRRINGTNKSPQSASRVSQSPAPANQNSGAVKKLLPHPDTKYLSQILSVPKMEELSECDEQEWLFSNSHSQVNKPKAEISWVDDTIPQVWAEPIRIESADLFALPYVIPR